MTEKEREKRMRAKLLIFDLKQIILIINKYQKKNAKIFGLQILKM